jgi:hypothetical protein
LACLRHEQAAELDDIRDAHRDVTSCTCSPCRDVPGDGTAYLGGIGDVPPLVVDRRQVGKRVRDALSARRRSSKKCIRSIATESSLGPRIGLDWLIVLNSSIESFSFDVMPRLG